MPKFRFIAEKHYLIEADNYDEALALLTDEEQYDFLVDETWSWEEEE